MPHSTTLSWSEMNLDESCHSAGVYGFQWRGSLGVEPVFIPALETSWKCAPQSHLMSSSGKSVASVSSSERLDSGALVFFPSAAAAAVDEGECDQGDKHDEKQDDHSEASLLQRTGFWEILQFEPHLVKNILQLLVRRHADSKTQVPRGDRKKYLRFLLSGSLDRTHTATPLQ